MSVFSKFTKRIVFTVLLALVALTLSAAEISVYSVGDLIQSDEYHYAYFGGELRVSAFNTVMPFASLGFSAGSRTAIEKPSVTETSSSTFSSRRTWSGINSYLFTAKAGVEYQKEALNGYRWGIGVYGVVRDHIRDEKDSTTGENKRIRDFTYGVGAEVSAIMPLKVMNDYIVNSARSALTFKISGAYDFQKYWNVGVSIGAIFFC